MPELPEVTTTVRGLQKILPGLVISHVWTDLAKKNQSNKQFKETIKSDVFFKKFKKIVGGAKILNVERRAKNILITLSNQQTILIHMKMTGHIMYGRYVFNQTKDVWTPAKDEREALHDPYNRFIHVVFTLSNGLQFVMCDSRKFGKITLIPTKETHSSVHLKNIGPEPLAQEFSVADFKKRILRKPNGNIKTVLMDQSIIAGIGNIYSDEMLWLSGIHPQSKPSKIPHKNLNNLYTAMKKVLNAGIDFGGDSTSDYRDIDGKRGNFQATHNAYRKTGDPCGKRMCNGAILRNVIHGRSAHFCNIHQKLYA